MNFFSEPLGLDLKDIETKENGTMKETGNSAPG